MSISRTTQVLEGIPAQLDTLEVSVDAVKTAVDAVKTSSDLGVATTPYIYNVTMTLADTEYSQALPAGCKAYALSVQDGDATKNFRYAFVTGKVATPTAPFVKCLCTDVPYAENLNLTAATLYFACSEAGKVMQIEAWV